MRTYIDSDILIWHLRGEPRATQFLRQMAADPSSELWIGAMQRAEIVFFMREEEVKATLALLAQFKTAPVTQAVVDQGSSIYRKWNPVCGIDINDAMLAATMLLNGGRIFTLNVKHYPMPDIPVARPW